MKAGCVFLWLCLVCACSSSNAGAGDPTRDASSEGEVAVTEAGEDALSCKATDQPPVGGPRCRYCTEPVNGFDAGICADGILNPACVNGVWRCATGGLVPEDM